MLVGKIKHFYDSSTLAPMIAHTENNTSIVYFNTEMSNRVLITGASGLLGRDCVKSYLSDSQHWTTLGLAYSRASGDLRRCDLTDKAQVEAVVREFKVSVLCVYNQFE